MRLWFCLMSIWGKNSAFFFFSSLKTWCCFRFVVKRRLMSSCIPKNKYSLFFCIQFFCIDSAEPHMTYWAGLIAGLKPICFFPMLLSVPADFCVLMCFWIAMVWCCQGKYNCLFDFFFFLILSKYWYWWSSAFLAGSTNIHTHMEIHTYPSQVLSHWANPAAWLRSHSWRQRRSFANRSLTAELLEQWLTE